MFFCFFFSPSHDRALTDAIYKMKLAPVYPVSSCNEIIRQYLKLSQDFCMRCMIIQ